MKPLFAIRPKTLKVKALLLAFLSIFLLLTTQCVKKDDSKIFYEDFSSDTEQIAKWKINEEEFKDNFSLLTDGGVDNSGCYKITNTERGELYISQVVENLEPGTLYRMKAKIKTENVEEGRGAILTVNMENSNQIWNASKFIHGTNDWQEVYIDFIANETGKAELCCRLGFHGGTTNGGTAKGTAWFDDVILEKTPADQIQVFEGEHVRFMVDVDKKSISDEEIQSWVTKLDLIYKSYEKLIGGVPYQGKKLDILTTPGVEKGYWALAGNPILWNNNVKIAESLEKYRDNDDWSFGILHEIGHVFSVGTAMGCNYWNWNDEIFANFRMSYAIEDCGGTVSQRDVLYKGRDIIDYYKIFYDETLGQKIAKNNGDALHYTFLRIKEKYGWEVYEKAFKKLYDCNNMPEKELKTSYEKLLYFLSHVSEAAGEDVVITCYTPEEMKLIEQSLAEK
ncbi:M60 family metallopeptidase [Dysgonomonas sp. Marseille-P4361]|uniref:M60 family metallopeptidase n=1 Tax=Dysgonomonas sp. Marseille-P4361 TaxID=2161820 RepID=UPI000D55CC3A|nr:M60 family metallopeptidase [Dysgonomonas sp. Marseille-P4361]